MTADNAEPSDTDSGDTERRLTAAAGQALAGDGDSLRIGAQRIRLEGLDAPELDQTCTRKGKRWRCGEEAKAALQAMLDAGTVSCRVLGYDKHDRALCVCYAGEREINRQLVEDGWAVAFTRYSPRYLPAQRRAQSAKRGIWSGQFQRPDRWRRRRGGRR